MSPWNCWGLIDPFIRSTYPNICLCSPRMVVMPTRRHSAKSQSAIVEGEQKGGAQVSTFTRAARWLVGRGERSKGASQGVFKVRLGPTPNWHGLMRYVLSSPYFEIFKETIHYSYAFWNKLSSIHIYIGKDVGLINSSWFYLTSMKNLWTFRYFAKFVVQSTLCISSSNDIAL